jgi:hypothetical protein
LQKLHQKFVTKNDLLFKMFKRVRKTLSGKFLLNFINLLAFGQRFSGSPLPSYLLALLAFGQKAKAGKKAKR